MILDASAKMTRTIVENLGLTTGLYKAVRSGLF